MRPNTRIRSRTYHRWGLLALGIGVLGLMMWTGIERWRSTQDAPVQDSTPLTGIESAPEQVVSPQPTETSQAPQISDDVVMETAPDFTLPALTGEMVSLSDYAGKPVLINFWATWCVPCRIEMPTIQSIFEEHDGALVVLAVNLEETQTVIRPFVDELELTFPILLDSDGLVTWQYAVIGLPTSIFVTPEGTIYRRYIGPMDKTFIEETLGQMDKSDRSSVDND